MSHFDPIICVRLQNIWHLKLFELKSEKVVDWSVGILLYEILTGQVSNYTYAQFQASMHWLIHI